MTSTTPNNALSSDEAAVYLGIAPQTLRRWRVTGDSPPYAKLGEGRSARVVYRIADLDEWLEARLVRPVEYSAV